MISEAACASMTQGKILQDKGGRGGGGAQHCTTGWASKEGTIETLT